MIKPLLCLFMLTLLACSNKHAEKKSTTLPPDNLTQAEAELRKKQVDDVSYQLSFHLDQDNLSFSGTSNIHFIYKGEGDTLRIDFYNGQVDLIELNGQSVRYDYDGAAIRIKTIHLNKGHNHLDIAFHHPYSNDGAGLYRYQDPADNHVYLYTNLEPFDANKVFPCFDQPNLKATYQMQVTAPTSWQVITSVRETKKTIQGNTALWEFPNSERFSTYIWSLHAGPYALFNGPQFRYPLRLFARQSLKPYINKEDWFTFTRQGFDFFDAYFGYAYPYKKYDQVIVPDFNFGAMENVAAVTFSEKFVSRGKKTAAERLSLASVIMHEMAHMWFGNLVTMNWWDDLWLNESFASFMEPLALSANTEFKTEAWLDFFAMKRWAYWTDEQPNTHPIAVPVTDTAKALTIFDGITYGKGSASLKQLMFKLDSQVFQRGLQNYFTTYALKNTTLNEFMGSLATAAKQPLTTWTDSWIKTAGLNRIKPEWQCEDGKLKTLRLYQSAPLDFPTLREHHLSIALLKKMPAQLSVNQTIKASITDTESEIKAVKGLACPDAIFINYQDYGYAKITIDDKSLQLFTEHLSLIQNRLLSQQVAFVLWQMLREGQLSLDQYISISMNHIESITDDLLLKSLLERIHGKDANSTSVLFYLGKLDKKKQKQLADQLNTLARHQVALSTKDSDRQKYWFNAWVKTALTPKQLDQLSQLLTVKAGSSPISIDQDMRWQIIEQLSEAGYPKALDIATAESKVDVSLMGQQAFLTTQAAFSNPKSKKRLLDEAIKKDSTMSLAEKKAVFAGLLPQTQDETARQRFAPDFFTFLTQFIVEQRSPSFLEAFIRLAPHECTAHSKTVEYLKQDNLPEVVKKRLTTQIFENGICAIIVEKANVVEKEKHQQ